MSDALIIKSFDVTVQGFDTVKYFSTSNGKARAEAWRDYRCGWTDCSFKRFMSLATVISSKLKPEGFGKPILVGGKPAFFIQQAGGNSILFARPNSDQTMLSHELDVSEALEEDDV